MPEKDDISSIYLLKNNSHVHIKSDLGASQYHTRILCVSSLIHRFHLQAVQQQAKQCLSSCFRFYERHSFILMTVRSEVRCKQVRGYHEAESDFQTFFFPLQQMQDPVEPVGWWLSLWQQQSWSLDFLCVWFYMVSFHMK